MDQTPTRREIIEAAERCAARSADGTITSRDVFWEITHLNWRGYMGGHRERPITLQRISSTIRSAGFQTEQYHTKGHSRFKRP